MRNKISSIALVLGLCCMAAIAFGLASVDQTIYTASCSRSSQTQVLSDYELMQFAGGLCGPCSKVLCSQTTPKACYATGSTYTVISKNGSDKCAGTNSNNCSHESHVPCVTTTVCSDSICSTCGEPSTSGSYYTCTES